MRLLTLSPLILLLVMCISSTAQACVCLTLTPKQSFEEADIVFEGELTRSTRLPPTDGLAYVAYSFEVRSVLKGEARREFTLVQAYTNCDAVFFPNIVYRVYARRHDGELSSSSCVANEALIVRKTNHYPAGFTFPWGRWQMKVLAIAAIGLVTTLIIRFFARGLRPQRS